MAHASGGIIVLAEHAAFRVQADSSIISADIGFAATVAPARTFSTTIVDLGDADLRLRFPLTVVVEECGDDCIASWPEVEAFGSGPTAADAINALKDEVSSLYRDLSQAPDAELGKLPLRWKRALAASISLA
jgi:hypothetical protein